jgi:short-subunit dehydrogenase
MIPYSVSKAGVIALTKALAKEVITEGIRVNCVAPGVIETPLLAQLTPDAVEYMKSKVPLGRMGRPEEVAAVEGAGRRLWSLLHNRSLETALGMCFVRAHFRRSLRLHDRFPIPVQHHFHFTHNCTLMVLVARERQRK